MHKELHYRLLALLMTVVTIFQFVIITPSAVFAESTEANAVTEEVSANAEPKEAAVAEVPVLKASAIPKPTSTVLCFTSDTHNKSGNVAAGRLGTWLDMVSSKYGGVTLMAFGGDMANASASESDFWTLTQADMNQLDERQVIGVYTTGNHEYSPGNYTNGKNTTTQKYVENQLGYEGSNFRIYCLGSSAYAESSGGWMGGWNTYSSSQVTTLTNYLNSVDNSKPIIVITHYPLHYNGSRTISGASDVIDVLNNAVESGKKIVYLWGHNHTDSDKNYDQIFVPGDSITYSSGNSKKVQFYYGAAGCMSDSEYGSGSASVKGKGLVLTIDSNNKLTFTYYDENGNNVTEGGTVTEADPVAVTGVTISQTSASLKERETIQLTATVSPSDATNKTVTWSSNNTGVATVSATGLVRGVSEGTATITVTTADGNYKANCTVTVTHNDNPSVEETIDITPTTSNPTESVSINVGDTLVINVENGSSSSAYDYSITLSNSSAAKINGDSTINIAAGATGQFTVEGIADGTVAITIKNNQSSSSYVRKATINLTVGAGSTTPVGDTVNITPSTDNPEESIRINVDDTLTINVTNGSSNSAYDFTATLSSTGIAQIQGNSTLNIAAGAIGQFTVKGLAEGTVDITIQNENSYGSQYVRKGIIHLTVGEGTTPVDPPSGDTVTYRLATTMEVGQEYIIANGNSGSVYVLSNEAGSSKQLKGISATVSDSTITLSAANAAKAVFSVTANSNSSQNGMWLMNGGKYLYSDSSSGLRLESSSTATSSSNNAKSWHYRSDRNLLWFFKDTSSSDGYTDTSSTYKYYLTVSSGVFTDAHVSTTSLENSSIPAMYLYVKDDTPADVTGVRLDKTSLTLKVGKTGTLTATVLPGNAQNKNVTWSSSNTSVATVNNGVVTAVANGTATITVTTEEGNFTATCTVTVSEITGTTYVLTDKIVDGGDYLIVSSKADGTAYALRNPGATSSGATPAATQVTVSDGTIETEAEDIVWTAEATGSRFNLLNGDNAMLAGKSGNLGVYTVSANPYSDRAWVYNDTYLLYQGGDYTYEVYYSNGFTARSFNSGNPTNPVYIYERVSGSSAVTGVTLDKTSLNLKVGRTATLTATVLPRSAQNKNVTWSSSNPAAATVNNGVVTAVAVGNTVITVTTEDGGFKATCQVTVSNATGTTYVLTDKLEDGKNYLIANGNTGSVYILSNEAGGSRELKGVSVEVVGDTITIDDDDISKVTFSSVKNSNSSQSGVWLMNGSQYLYADSSDGLRLVASSTQTSSSNNAKSWHYKADNKNILWFFKDTSSSDGYTDTSQTYKYFLKVSSGNFTDDHVSTTSLGNTTTPAMYLFVEDNGTAPHTHTYGQPTWNWAADHKSATATFTCTAGDDTQTVTDNAPAEAVVSAATCTADKVVKYTATVTFNGTQYTATSENVTVEGTATGHTYGQPSWSWADDYKSATATFTCTSGDDTKTVKDNAPVETIVSAATCTADKVAKYTAKVTFNGTEYTVTADNVAVPNTATGHNWGRPTYTWANDYSSVTASCTCRNDSSHVETETVATVTEITTAATCTTKGETTYTANFSSSAFTTQTMTIDDVPALGHDYVWRVTKEATCTAKGQETGTCSRCGDEQTREIEALGHAMEHYEAQAATCTTSGWKAYDECARCGYSTYESIPALGHSMVHHNAKAATCTEVGWAEYDECSRCDYTTYKEIEALGHDLIHHDAKAATCEEVGWEAYDTCSRCDHTTYVEIAATGHNWGRPTYTWADDMSSVTAKSVCSKDATHIKEETVATTCEIIKEATIEEEGEKKYTAIFKDELFEAQTMTVTIPKESVYPISFEKFANTTKGINVAWDAVEDPELKEYALYRSEAGKNQWKLVAEGLTATKYTDSDTTLKSGELYDYKLVVTKNSGSKYDAVRSNWRYVGATVMNAPTCTRAGIRVTWPKVEGAAKYEIYRSIGAGTPHWELLTTVDATDADLQVYNHTNIEEPGTWYAYTVRAIHEDGTYGGQPGGRSILFRAPVKVVKAESISSGVRVTFTTVAAGYTYRLYRCTKVNGKWSDPEQITDLVKTYTGNPQNVWIYDKTAQNGQTYKYYVRCVSKDGAVPLSSYENEIQITYKKP